MTFDPIKILTHSGPQNDLQNLSFVNDKHTFSVIWPYGEKLPRKGVTKVICKFSFVSLFCSKTDIWVFCVFCVFLFFVIIYCTNQDLDLLSNPKNDHLYLSFVKDKDTVGKTMTKYGLKMASYQLQFFWNSLNMHMALGYI